MISSQSKTATTHWSAACHSRKLRIFLKTLKHTSQNVEFLRRKSLGITVPVVLQQQAPSLVAGAAALSSGAPELHPDVLSVVYSADDLAAAVQKLGR